MKIREFKMERWQSIHENVVQYNLAESGVLPFTVRELVGNDLENFSSARLGYGHTNGSPELRELISHIYKEQTDRNILVTNGSSEANFISIWNLVERGTKIAMMLPNYMQIKGLTQALGAKLKSFKLLERNDWAPDIEKLKEIVDKSTKLIIVCNPNNPTGAVLSSSDMKAISDLASDNKAWILSDEVYQGAEFNGSTTPSFLDIYDRTVVTSGLSKAYGLPGLRIGWVAGPESLIAQLWSNRDYTTIAPSVVSDLLARIALKKRKQILERTRSILHTNLPILQEWVDRSDTFSFVKPTAGAIAFMRYQLKSNSTELARKICEHKSVLVVPGDHFEMDGHLRIGYGDKPDYLRAGLDLIHQFVQESAVG